MEVKIILTEHALQTVRQEFDYLKENISVEFAYKFRDEFPKQVESILPFYLKYSECRFLPTKNKIYRNIIWGNYLIIFKILEKEILVLGIFHSSQNSKKLKSFRRIKK